jgi:ankyrin repeat protein
MANTGLAGMGNNEDEEFNAAISALKSLCDGRPLPPPADVIKLVPKSNLNATNTQGRSLVNLTARAGDEDVLRALIHAGADVNMCDQFGISALMLAANWGWTRSVEILLKAKADTTAAERSTGSSSPLHPGRNALMAAADRDHEKIVRQPESNRAPHVSCRS